MGKVGIAQGPLHYRALQRQHINSIHQSKRISNNTKVYLTGESLTDLQWCISMQIHQFNKCLISLPAFDLIIYSDASNQGWGAQCNRIMTGGRWNIQESRQHINILEMKAALLAILSDNTGNNAATYWSADGQLYCSCLCQQERGNQVFNFSSLGSRDLECLSTERNMDNSTTPSGSTECRCGLGFSSFQQTHRVDSGQGDLCTYSHQLLHSTSRLVRISVQSSTTPLCFPVPRPGCNGGRCNDIEMEQMDIVHSCANYNASPHSEEDTRRSGNLSSDCPKLATPDMVSATIGDVGQHPVHSANDGNESVSIRSLRHPYGLLERRNEKEIHRSLATLD